MYKFIAVLALITMAFWGCKDEINNTGYDILLPGDLVSANKVSLDKAAVRAYTVTDEKLRTSKPDYNLLGTFVDPVFGKTTADFACQFRLSETPKFKQGDRIDSLVFYMTYRSFYGDTVTVQNLKAYELTTDLDAEDTVNYYQDIDLKALTNKEVVADINHRVIFRDSLHSASDSTRRDTITITVRMKLSQVLAQKIMAVSDSALRVDPEDPNIPFLKFFKGLYIEAGDLTEGGAIMRAAPQALIMYTPKTTTATDTTKGSVATYYYVTKNSARVNRFVHNYSTTTFAASLDQQNQQDSLIYLQTTGGLSSKIYIPELDNWIKKDSSNIAINKAEIIFNVEQAYADTNIFTPPPRLILSLLDETGAITDTLGQLIYPADLKFSESYYGGTFNEADGTYHFNLAGFVQQLIKERNKNKGLRNNGFYLTTDNKNSIFNRVVLKGATSKTGIRFEITYSRIK